MKRFAALLLACLLALAVGCSFADKSSSDAFPHEDIFDAISEDRPVQNDIKVNVTPGIASIHNGEPVQTDHAAQSGLLTAYRRKNELCLAWVDPDSEAYSVYRLFQASDQNVQIDPYQALLRYDDQHPRGKKLYLQQFDSEYSKVMAKNTADNSWGWVDTSGDYTNVTSRFFDAYVHGIGFYKDRFYFLHETKDGGRTISQDAFCVSIDDPSVLISDGISMSYWRNQVPDYFPSDDFYLIQEGDDGIRIYPFGGGSTTRHVPVFSDRIGGYCTSGVSYDDWVDEYTAINTRFGAIYLKKAQYLGDKDFWNGDFDQKSGELLVDHGALLKDRSSFYEIEYANPIVCRSRNCFACIQINAYTNSNGSVSTKHEISLFDYSGNKISDRGQSSILIGEESFGLGCIIDWVEN